MRDLTSVLADARADADVLDRRGHHEEATSIRKLCADVEEGAREYLVFLPELEAALFSGESGRTLRRRFPVMEARGHAYRRGRTRFYRQCALRRRARTNEAFLDGARAAEGKVA